MTEKQKQYERKRNKTPARIAWTKNRDLTRAFGITLQQYNALVIKQNNCCAICKMPEAIKQNGKVQDLAVDHDHQTGKVRELLCGNCNHALGKLKEDEDIILSMLEYIKKHKRLNNVIKL